MIVMFLGFGGLPQLAVALQNRSVWFKHREAQEYTAAAYAWSMSLVQMPMSLIEALVFSSIIYFMVGFTTGAFSPPPPLSSTLLLSPPPRRAPLCRALPS